MILIKLVGWGLLILGGLLVIAFPGAGQDQPEAMTKAGIIIGILMIGVGLLLIKL